VSKCKVSNNCTSTTLSLDVSILLVFNKTVKVTTTRNSRRNFRRVVVAFITKVAS